MQTQPHCKLLFLRICVQMYLYIYRAIFNERNTEAILFIYVQFQSTIDLRHLIIATLNTIKFSTRRGGKISFKKPLSYKVEMGWKDREDKANMQPRKA